MGRLVMRPMTWNIGASQRKTLALPTRPSTPKLTAVAKALAQIGAADLILDLDRRFQAQGNRSKIAFQRLRFQIVESETCSACQGDRGFARDPALHQSG